MECAECAVGYQFYDGFCMDSSFIYTIICDSQQYFDEEQGVLKSFSFLIAITLTILYQCFFLILPKI